jgi:glycosyltransferase involved in cell wall biosynthesis
LEGLARGESRAIIPKRLHILMVAPEPIFEPRGTPLSVVGRLKALSDMGHHVDLVTYPFGRNVDFPNVRIYRTGSFPGIRRIKIGPSLQKIPLDFLLMIKTLTMALKNRYHLIHTHEEAGLWGLGVSRIFGIPHIYDMHSSLPQQLTNFKFTRSRFWIGLFERMEHWILKYSSGVITICQDLFNYVKRMVPERGSELIENVIEYGSIFGEKDTSAKIVVRYHLKNKKVILYAGTFESYQGIELLIDAAEHVLRKIKSAVFLLLGGHQDQVEKYQKMVRGKGLSGHFIFTGQVFPENVSSYIRCADVLVSPRMAGTNTPLKIYSYLRSGVPIVATRLWTHTQVLFDEVSVLVEPTGSQFAQGICSVLLNPTKASRLSEKAKILAEEKYSHSKYIDKLNGVIRLAMTRGAS